MSHHGRHEAGSPAGPLADGPVGSPEPAPADVPAAAAGGRARSVLVGVVAVAVLGIQLAFTASYAGALHAAEPRDLPVAAAVPEAQRQPLGQALAEAGAPVVLHDVDDAAAAERQVRNGDVDGAFVVEADGPHLLVASAGGPATVTALQAVFEPVAQSAGAPLQVDDLVPLPAGDSRGLVSFYLLVGWVVGGYLLSAVLGVSLGMTPTGLRAGLARLALLAGYAVASGVLGTVVVDAGYGYLVGSPVATAALGALVVLAVGAASMALQAMFGIIGTALVLLLFVVAGNPSAGGPWPSDLLASPWREVGPWLPNGAGLAALRDAVYFTGSHLGGPLAVLAAWAVLGVVGTALLSARGRPLAALPTAR